MLRKLEYLDKLFDKDRLNDDIAYVLTAPNNLQPVRVYIINPRENTALINMFFNLNTDEYINPQTNQPMDESEIESFKIPFYSFKHSISSIVFDNLFDNLEYEEVNAFIEAEEDFIISTIQELLENFKLSNRLNNLFDITEDEFNFMSFKVINTNGIILTNNDPEIGEDPVSILLIDPENYKIGKNSITLEFTYNDPDKYWLQNIKSNIEISVNIINNIETDPTDPETDPTDPETDPTDPETDPTDPTDPETDPTDPETDPE